MTTVELVNMMNTIRGFTLHTVQDLEAHQLMNVPEGCSNNILWNLGHIVCIQCALIYRPSGLPLPVPDYYVEKFYDRTSPDGWDEAPDATEVLATIATINQTVVRDAQAGAFSRFQPFELLPGLTLETPDQAVHFHTVHESMHLGVIMTLKKLV